MMMSKAAQPTAQARGLPPKVEPCVPGPNDGAMRSVVSIAPMGKPLPRAFALVRMSGAMPPCW